MKITIFFVSLIIFVGLLTLGTILSINFSINCTQYLKRASDANTIELANNNLKIAIKYLENKCLTNGIISIFLHQPKNDIGFFYNNLLASHYELNKITTDSTQLEKSNVLIKLRETLTDNTRKGTKVISPDGISIYPYNKLFFWLMIISGIFIFGISFLLTLPDLPEDYNKKYI